MTKDVSTESKLRALREKEKQTKEELEKKKRELEEFIKKKEEEIEETEKDIVGEEVELHRQLIEAHRRALDEVEHLDREEETENLEGVITEGELPPETQQPQYGQAVEEAMQQGQPEYMPINQNTIERMQELTYQAQPWTDRDVQDYEDIKNSVERVLDQYDGRAIPDELKQDVIAIDDIRRRMGLYR